MPAENSVSRLQRFLLLLPWLKANPGVTIADAAKHFRISPAQLISDLRDIGATELPGMFPADSISIQFWRPDDDDDADDVHVDQDCSIVVLQSLQFDRPMKINATDASRLVLALDVLQKMVGDGFPAIGTARTTLANLAHLSGSDGATSVSGLRVTSSPALSTIMQAFALNSCLELEYVAGDDARTTRTVEPLELEVEGGGQAKLHAWCHSAGGVRTFRLDRILRATISDAAPRRPETIAGSPSLASSAALVVQVCGPAESAWALEDLPGISFHSERGQFIVASFPAGSLLWAAQWALSHADVVTVTGPAELVDLVKSRARAALEAS